MFDRLICMRRGHLPNRRKVTQVEGTYHGQCVRCGARIKRIKRDHWIMVWPWG